jgi:sulfoxide reductase heme-binding subunit YedZ
MIRALKAVVFAAALVPAVWLTWGAFYDRLGPNPIEYITRSTGTWTLRFLLLTLAVTPLRKELGIPALIRFRRMLGLFAFFYGCLHLVTYLWLDKFFDGKEIVMDVVKRPFITAGATGFLLMLPLAATSTTGWIRRLGGKRWRALHRLIYLSATAGVIHYYWLVKSDVRLPVMYGAILALLLLHRAVALAAPRFLAADRAAPHN